MENINDTLDQALVKKDIGRIREILSGFITADQGFSKGVLDEKIRYCESMGVSRDDIFVPFTGEPLNKNSAEWDIPYFVKQRVQFDANFSSERLEHLREVGEKLFPASAGSEAEKRNRHPSDHQRPFSRSSRTDSNSSGTSYYNDGHSVMLRGAIVVGGVGAVVGGVIAAASGSAVLGGVLIGGIAGAAVGAVVGGVLGGGK